MKNRIFSFLLLSGILAISGCAKYKNDKELITALKQKLTGEWKVSDAKINYYDRGMLRKNQPVHEYDDRVFTFLQNDSFYESGNDEFVHLHGKWNIYIIDTEDGGSDAVEEGEDYTENLFLFYSNENGNLIDKTSMQMNLKNGGKKLKCKMETPNGTVHLTLTKS